jgi:hypothetical protein
MFADLGHFSKLSLRVNVSSSFFNDCSLASLAGYINVPLLLWSTQFLNLVCSLVMAAWIHNCCVSLLSPSLHG